MAVSPAPAVARMARLLDAMAVEPDRWWALAELARITEISKASAHGVLLAMVEEGYVRRRDDPVSYALGPALVELGERARSSIDISAAAGPELDSLRAASECTAMAAAVRGSQISVLAVAPVPHPFGLTVQVGHRSSFAAPLGTVYAAWSRPATVERWIGRAQPAFPSSRRRQLLEELDLVRSRGWSATLRATGTSWPTREALDADLAGAEIDVVGIGAPVAGASGSMECSVAIVGLPPRLTGSQVRDLAARVVEAAAAVAASLLDVG